MEILTKKKKASLIEQARREGLRDGLNGQVSKDSNYENLKVLLQPEEDTSLVEAMREVESHIAESERSLKAKLRSLAESVVPAYTALVDGISYDTAKLNMFQKRAAIMFREDVLIRSVGNLTVNSVIGNGVKFSVGNPEVDEYLKWYWSPEGVNMEERQKEICLHRYLLGEYFLVHVFEEQSYKVGEKTYPKLYLRRFYPWDIPAILTRDDDIEELQGVEYNLPGTGGKATYPNIQRYLNPERFSGQDYNFTKRSDMDLYVQYIRFNDGFDIRGYPQVLCLLRWATILKEIMYDTAQKYHEWSKVLYMLTVQQREKDWSVNVERRAPKGGTVVVNTPNAKWETASSKLDADGLEAVWLHSLYYFSAGAGYPYQYIVQDYSNNNLASSREARVPLVMTIRNQQDSLHPEFILILRAALKRGVETGVLPPKVKVPVFNPSGMRDLSQGVESILRQSISYADKIEAIARKIQSTADYVEVDAVHAPIQLIFPQISAMSEKEQAEVVEIYHQMGLDQQSVFEMLNMDWSIIMARKITQADFDMQLAKRRGQMSNQDPFNVSDDDAGGV